MVYTRGTIRLPGSASDESWRLRPHGSATLIGLLRAAPRMMAGKAKARVHQLRSPAHSSASSQTAVQALLALHDHSKRLRSRALQIHWHGSTKARAFAGSVVVRLVSDEKLDTSSR